MVVDDWFNSIISHLKDNMIKYHYVDEKFDSKWNMCTILNGPHKYKIGCVCVGFSCGTFIISLGTSEEDDEEICIFVNKKDLQFWESIKSIDTRFNPPIIERLDEKIT